MPPVARSVAYDLPVAGNAGTPDRLGAVVRVPLPDLALVAAGGALGAVARHGVEEVVPSVGGFPLATFTVNVLGAFVLGALLRALALGPPRSPALRLFAAVGVLGAFTTVSSFVVEADLLVRDGRWGLAVGYLAATLAAGLVASRLGVTVSRPRRLR